MTLNQWAMKQPYLVRAHGRAYHIPDSARLVDRAEAWSLEDYLVSSVSGGTIWFLARAVDGEWPEAPYGGQDLPVLAPTGASQK